MSDASKPNEFITKFSNVEFNAVPLEKCADPNTLSPEMRIVYERIVVAIGSKYVGITKDGKFSMPNPFEQDSKPNRPFRVVPPEERPDPNALSPEQRMELHRIVTSIGSGFVGVTKNGDLYVIGTMTQHCKDGSTKQNQPFIVFTSKTKNGIVLDHAGDMAENCSDPTVIYRAKATVVPGREDGKGGRFPNSLRLSFPEKEADFLARHASRTKSKDEAQQEILF
jgi:hypothetical protein